MKAFPRDRLGTSSNNQTKYPPAFSSGSVISQSRESVSADANVTPVGKSCIYFARGYCKHGSSCRFAHGAPVSSSSPSTQRFSRAPTQLPSTSSPQSSIDATGNSDQHWLLQLQSELQDLLSLYSSPITVASLPHLYLEKYGKILQSEGPESEGNRNGRNLSSLLRLLGRLRTTFTIIERPDGQKAVSLKRPPALKTQDAEMGSPSDSPCSRQIYLTFPCESTFTEADVATHFGAFGTVNDVRIPYQQRRMFGFVTFASPSAVKAVLKQVNPHYICGSRVLVKPYKDKPKTSDRYKYVEATRGVSTESSGSHRGSFENKPPPRHAAARTEVSKSGAVSRSSLVQSWKPVRAESQSQQTSHQTPLKNIQEPDQQSSEEPQKLEGGKASHPQVDQELSQQQHSADGEIKSDNKRALPQEELCINAENPASNNTTNEDNEAPVLAEEAPVAQTPHQTETVAVDFQDTPLPRVKLFYDDTKRTGSEIQHPLLETQSSSPVEDWNIDLESILPDSPFSSPKRTPQTTPVQHSASDDGPGQTWHCSAPSAPYSHPESWVYHGDTMMYLPPASAPWGPQEYIHPKPDHHQMIHPLATLDDLQYAAPCLPTNPYQSGTSQYQIGKEFYNSNHHPLCTTCRQQVLGPNSQCACCQQMLCHNVPHANHLVHDMGSSWHVPVNAYVRASPK